MYPFYLSGWPRFLQVSRLDWIEELELMARKR
jgi:hypothetical protein